MRRSTWAVLPERAASHRSGDPEGLGPALALGAAASLRLGRLRAAGALACGGRCNALEAASSCTMERSRISARAAEGEGCAGGVGGRAATDGSALTGGDAGNPESEPVAPGLCAESAMGAAGEGEGAGAVFASSWAWSAAGAVGFCAVDLADGLDGASERSGTAARGAGSPVGVSAAGSAEPTRAAGVSGAGDGAGLGASARRWPKAVSLSSGVPRSNCSTSKPVRPTSATVAKADSLQRD